MPSPLRKMRNLSCSFISEPSVLEVIHLPIGLVAAASEVTFFQSSHQTIIKRIAWNYDFRLAYGSLRLRGCISLADRATVEGELQFLEGCLCISLCMKKSESPENSRISIR